MSVVAGIYLFIYTSWVVSMKNIDAKITQVLQQLIR